MASCGPAPVGSGQAMTFELRNADGSEAEMSGNGIRCLVHAAIDSGAVKARDGDSLGVLTAVGQRQVLVRKLSQGWLWASTDMGAPKVRGERERCNVGHGQLFVEVGNPHLVVLGPDPMTVDVATLGPALSAEAGSATGGVNVEFVTLGRARRTDDAGLGTRGGRNDGLWHRLVAAATALHHWGRVGSKVTVNQPGGAAEVELRPDGSATLSGPSRRIGRCWLDGGGAGPCWLEARGAHGGESEVAGER